MMKLVKEQIISKFEFKPLRKASIVAGLIALLSAIMPLSAFAAAESAPVLDGSVLSLYWGIPFAGILLSIALFPLVLPTI